MAAKLPDPPIRPARLGEGVHPLAEILPNLGDQPVIEAIAAGYPPEHLLEHARVVCFRGEGYPRVDDHTGHILCPDDYQASHDPLIVYLDIVHELVHVRQVLEGKQVYHFPEPYVRWPTEIEAYTITYEEAKRLGVPDDWFWEYLAVPWVEDEELAELGQAIGLPEAALPGTADEEGARH